MTDMTTSNLVPRPHSRHRRTGNKGLAMWLAREDWVQGSGHVVGMGGLGTRVWPCGWQGRTGYKGLAMWLAWEDLEQGSGHVVGMGGLGTRVWPCGWHGRTGNKGLAMWLAREDWVQGSGHVVGMGTRVGCFVVCAILDQCVY